MPLRHIKAEKSDKKCPRFNIFGEFTPEVITVALTLSHAACCILILNCHFLTFPLNLGLLISVTSLCAPQTGALLLAHIITVVIFVVITKSPEY